MIYSVADLEIKAKPETLRAEHLAWLAETYDRISQPVWIHDLTSNCVYRNRLARFSAGTDVQLAKFDILDHDDKIIGHLTTTAN